jgi:hypothetical protein
MRRSIAPSRGERNPPAEGGAAVAPAGTCSQPAHPFTEEAVSAVPEIQIAELEPTVAVTAVAGPKKESTTDTFQPGEGEPRGSEAATPPSALI